MSRALKIVLSVVLVGHVASAQTAAPEEKTQPSSADVTVPQQATLSPQEMLNQAQEYRATMNEVLTRLESMVEQARKEKDVIKLNCLNDKLVQAKANINVADEAMKALQEAAAKNDQGAISYEYSRVSIVNQKIQVLAAEAEGCVGEELGFVGPTRVDVDVDPDLRQDDPTEPGSTVLDVSRPANPRPMAATPIQ